MDDNTLISFGGAVKAIGRTGNLLTVGGRAIIHGSPSQKDLVGDWFTPKTYLGAHKGQGVDVMLHHGIPLKAELAEYADAIYGTVTKTEADSDGLLWETVLDLSGKYQRKVAELIEAELLSTSTGAVSHLVRRAGNAKAGEILRWPLGEFSFTPTPCEGRLSPVTLKSLLSDEIYLNSEPVVAAVKCLTDTSFSLNVPLELSGSDAATATPENKKTDEIKWDESQHPRADDGKFGSGGGASNPHGNASAPINHADHHVTKEALSSMTAKEARVKLRELQTKRKQNREDIKAAAKSGAAAPERQRLIDESIGLESAMDRLRSHIADKEPGRKSADLYEIEKEIEDAEPIDDEFAKTFSNFSFLDTIPALKSGRVDLRLSDHPTLALAAVEGLLKRLEEFDSLTPTPKPDG